MKKWVLITVSGILLCSLLISENNSGNSKITEQLQEKMESTSESEFIRINIAMNEQYDSQTLLRNTNELSKPEKREFVVNQLKSFSNESQKDILTEMEILENEGLIQNIKSLWITNLINCFATKEAIREISLRNDIKSIDWDEERNMLLDYNVNEQKYITNNSTDRDITWNVTLVDADDVWALGYTGEGVIVAVVDTGIRYTHLDLQDHIWQSDEYPNHGYDFANNDNDPMDDHGHGTHCAGTVAGDGTAGTQTGMAPDATIMCLKVLDNTGNGNESNVWSAMEFAVENGADVVSMSLGWQHSWGVNREAWRNCMDNSLAAGLISSVAAGNEGDYQWNYPIPDNVRSPGDCPPPWLHPDQTLISGTSGVVCVGATDSNDNLASFSSRGPVTWQDVTGYNDYAYDPEMGLIRPDISAPGSDITSLGYWGDSAYEYGWDGTSMATPCVAGVMALMLSKNYLLSPAQISQLIEENAAVPQSPKNNDFGSGRIDALAAVNAANPPDSPPGIVTNPLPADFGIDVVPFTNLSWENGDGGIPDHYLIYFGSDDPPTNIIDGLEVTELVYDLPESLDFETQYFWKIDAFNEFGSSMGQVWNFTTSSASDEDFETGDFSLFDWTFSGNAEWFITDSESANGSYSARSGAINNFHSSSLILEEDIVIDGEISFWKKVSSEEIYDELKFLIDGEILGEWSGEIDWSREVFPVELGHHTFEWKYVKFNGGDVGEDCTWIDFICFPEFGELPHPILEINPAEFIVELGPDEGVLEYMDLTNAGEGILNYSIGINFTSPQNGWISMNSSSGELYTAETDNIRLGIYSNNVDPGVHTCELEITDDIRNVTIVPVTLTVNATESGNETTSARTELLGNYPNPIILSDLTENATTISFYLEKNSRAKLSIYDMRGQKVTTLVDDNLDSGKHDFFWDGRDKYQKKVASGVYYYKLRVENYTSVKKMIIMK